MSYSLLPNGIYKELDWYLLMRDKESKKLSAGTIAKYIQQYNYLTKTYGDIKRNWILDSSQDELITILNNMITGPQSKSNYLNIFLVIRQYHKFPVDKLIEFKNGNFESIITAMKDKLITKQDLPSYDVVKKYINNLYKTGEYQRFIINWSIYEFGLRNKDMNLRIVTLEQFNLMNDADKINRNFIIIHPSFIEYHIDDYKTRGAYGLKRWTSSNSKINKAVCMQGLGLLISNKNGELLKDDNIGYHIQLYDKDNLKLTEADYYKIRLIELSKSANPYKALGDISKTRGSNSIQVLNNSYNINPN